MHELSLTHAMVEACVQRAGDRRVRRVVLEVGERAGVAVDAVRFCFDVCCAGTLADGATLEVVTVAGERLCVREMEVG